MVGGGIAMKLKLFGLSLLVLASACAMGQVIEKIPISQGSGPVYCPPKILSTERTVKRRMDLPRFFTPPNPRGKNDRVVDDYTIVPPEADEDLDQNFSIQTPGNISRSWQGFVRDEYSPADPTIAAGPNEVVAAINDDFSIWDKEGNLLNTWDINDFLNDDRKIFDPKIMYDVFDNRWLIAWVLLDTNTTAANSDSAWILMVSDNSTAQGNWYVYELNAKVIGSTPNLQHWADYPYIGVDADGVALSANNIGWFGGTGGTARMRFLRKSQIYAGNNTINWWDWTDLSTNGVFDRSLALSVHTFAGGAMYCVNSQMGGGSNVVVRRITGTTFPNNTSPVSVKDDQSVTAYAAPLDLDQGPGFRDLDSVDARIMNCVTVDDHLLFAHATNANFSGNLRTAIRNYRYNTASDSIVLESTFGSGSSYSAFPAIAATPDLSDSIITYANAGPSDEPNMRYVGRLFSEGSWGSAVVSASGLAFFDAPLQNESRNRWGDYSGAALDPWDDETFWIHGKAASTTTQWRTRVVRVNRKPDTVLTLNNAAGRRTGTTTLTATLRRADNNAAVSGKTVSFFRGTTFLGSGVTNASGVASDVVSVGSIAPGSYTISADFNDALDVNGDEDTATLTVNKNLTLVTVNNEIVTYSGNAQWTANLKNSTNNTNLQGESLSFRVNGIIVGSAVTNASGNATVQFQFLQAAPPSGSILVDYVGDTNNEADSDTATVTVNKANTAIQIQSGQGAVGEVVPFVAQLRRTTDNDNINGRTINFTFNGVGIGSAVTNPQGFATLNAQVPAGAPSQAINIVASFAGDTFYNSNSANNQFTRWARKLQGTLTLQAWQPNESGTSVNMQITTLGGVQQSAFSVLLGNNGAWSHYTNFATNGNFIVRAKASHWLSQGPTVNLNGGVPGFINHLLLNGDCNNDNEVGAADFSVLAAAYDSVQGDPNYNANADLNGDEEVGAADFSILAANYDEVGT